MIASAFGEMRWYLGKAVAGQTNRSGASALARAVGSYRAGNFAQAERSCKAILRKTPNHFDALHILGLLRSHAKRYEEAHALLSRALAINPNWAEAHYNHSIVLRALGRFEEEFASLDRAVALNPNYFEAFVLRGVALASLRPDDALASFDAALALKPDYAVFNNRGLLLQQLKRPEQALESYEQALTIKADDPTTLNNRGATLLELGRPAEALASFDKALAIKTNDVDALTNCAFALRLLNRLDDALESLNRAIELNPTHADAHWNRSLCNLQLGNFETGWEEYEWRWQTKNFDPSERKITLKGYAARYPSASVWDGSYVDGALLGWGAQGIGDQIFFAGMLDDLRHRARRLIVEVEPRLVRLFRRSFPGIEVFGNTDEPYPGMIDCMIALGSLGRHLRRGLSAFPQREGGYLHADSSYVTDLRQRLDRHGEMLVGLSWHSVAPVVGRERSIPLEKLRDLLRSPACRFVDLQYGDTSQERAALERTYGVQIAQCIHPPMSCRMEQYWCRR